MARPNLRSIDVPGPVRGSSCATTLLELRRRLEGRLGEIFADLEREVRERVPEVGPVVAEVRGLTVRGGKRLRPAFVLAAVEASA